MAMRDKQSDLAVISQSVVVDAAETTVGAAINTIGARSVTFVVNPSRALAAVGTEVFRLVVQEADTEGGTYTAVAANKILPARNQHDDGQLLFNATSPWEMTFGVVDTKEWIKVGVVCSLFNAAATFAIDTIMEGLERPFTLYDPTVVSDGKP